MSRLLHSAVVHPSPSPLLSLCLGFIIISFVYCLNKYLLSSRDPHHKSQGVLVKRIGKTPRQLAQCLLRGEK